MAEVSRDQLNEVVSRVMDDVMQEVKSEERAFGVADLRGHLKDLTTVGGNRAWSISYSTASERFGSLRQAARPGGEVAWSISYSTASAALEETAGGETAS